MEENRGESTLTEIAPEDFKEKIKPEDTENSQKPARIRFKCSKCGKLLLTPQGMKKHLMITHGSERLFKCSQCPKTFKHSQNLTTHKKCHDENAKIACLCCDKKFTTRGNLKKHLRTHVSSVEQLEEMWISQYTSEQTRKHMRKVERIPEQKPSVDDILNVENLLDWGSCSRSEVIVKKEEMELIKNSRSSGSRVHLRLGKMMSTAIPGFMNGTLFPAFYLDHKELDFESDNVPELCMQKCPECDFGHTRSMLREHVDEHHPEILNKMCFICCQKVNDKESHEEMHREVEVSAHFIPKLATLNRSILEFELSDHKSIYYQSADEAAAELLQLYKNARNDMTNLVEEQPKVDEVVQTADVTIHEIPQNLILQPIEIVMEPRNDEEFAKIIDIDTNLSSSDSSIDSSEAENCAPLSQRLPLGRPPASKCPPKKKRKRLFSTDSDYSDDDF